MGQLIIGYTGADPKPTKSEGRLFISIAQHPDRNTTRWVSCFADDTTPGIQNVKKGCQVVLACLPAGRDQQGGERFNIAAVLSCHTPVRRERAEQPADHNQEVVS